MNAKTIVAVGLALALVPLLPTAYASHSGTYRFNPVEHDDQGRSNEPDFQTTSVLGPLVANKVIDTNLDGIAVPDAALPPTPAGQADVLAPGCTDDQGRQPSGLCGLFTVGAGTPNTGQVVPSGIAGISGMSGSAAPGRFTPTKGTSVRYLDTLTHAQFNSAGSVYLEYNKKLGDLGVQDALAGLDGSFGGNAILGQTAIWPFYGKWTDKNGNGVVDHLGGTTEAPAPADNEFVWYGNCLAFGGAPNPNSITNGYCAKETNPNGGGAAEMVGYIYPGNHHAICPFAVVGNECIAHPGDLPGRQVFNFVDTIAGGPVLNVGIQNLDDYDATVGGDPLFGPQDSVAPDQKFDDRTGDPNIGTRQWVYGLGWSTWFYDQSLLGTITIVTAVNCAKDDTNPNAYILSTCTSVDVDRYPTWSPVAEQQFASLKATARSNWVTVRSSYEPLNTAVDGVLNNRAIYDASQGPVQGDLGARTQNAGFSREPNNAGDSFPGATFGSCTGEARHNGWCNSYAGYAGAPRAWTDVQPGRSIYYNRPVTVTGSACTLCVAGPAQDLGLTSEPILGGKVVRDSGDHRRTLGPGGYYFVGVLGLWHDRTQVRQESSFDLLTLSPVTTTYVEAPDGWVGSIVNATGTFYYRGYTNEACTTDKGAGVYPYANCHPYLDGNILDPQQAGATNHGEWDADCSSSGLTTMTLTPDGGVWTVPVLVWRDHEQGVQQVAPNPDLPELVDLTGTSGPITLDMACRTSQADTSGVYLSADFVLLPAGNLDLGVTTSLTARVELPGGGLSIVRDVDRYEPWGVPGAVA